MPRYHMQTWFGDQPHGPYESRKRRDAAALLFERKVYSALEACALLDRKVAYRSMDTAKRAYDNDQAVVVVKVQDYTVMFFQTS